MSKLKTLIAVGVAVFAILSIWGAAYIMAIWPTWTIVPSLITEIAIIVACYCAITMSLDRWGDTNE